MVSGKDRETVMAVLEPVSTFILAASITDRPYLMSARTLTRSRVALIPSEELRRVFAEDPSFAAPIVADLADGFRTSVKQLKNMKLRSSIERLANYLLRRDEETGGSGRFELPVEKRLLASWLGVRAENLSRAFSALREFGVTATGPVVHLEDITALRNLAKPSGLIDRPD